MKRIKNYSQFRGERSTNEEIKILDDFFNLFKSKKVRDEEAQEETQIKEWLDIHEKLKKEFSNQEKLINFLKNDVFKKAKDEDTKCAEFFFGMIYNINLIRFPFTLKYSRMKYPGIPQEELSQKSFELLKELIFKSLKFKNDLIETKMKLENLNKKADEMISQLEEKYGEDKSNKLIDGYNLKPPNIDVESKKLSFFDLNKDVLVYIKECFKKMGDYRRIDGVGDSAGSGYVKENFFSELIFGDENKIDQLSQKLGKAFGSNFTCITLECLKSFNSGDVKEKILRKFSILELLKLDFDKQFEIDCFDRDGSCNLTVSDYKWDFLKNKIGIDTSPTENLKRVYNFFKSFRKEDLEKLIEIKNEILNSLDNVKTFEDYMKKYTITVPEIIKEDGLTDKDIYFGHIGYIKNLTKEKLDFDPSVRGRVASSTPEDRWGFYLTTWKHNKIEEMDLVHYYGRANSQKDISVEYFRGEKEIQSDDESPYLYTVKFKEGTKLMRTWGFSQTNESTEQVANYMKTLGISGYYGRPYGEKSAIEIVVIDKDCIASFKMDQEGEDTIKRGKTKN